MRRDPPRLWTEDFYRCVNPETRSAGFHKAEAGWASPLKDALQTDFDVWYVAAGSGQVLVDGRWQAFETGDLVMLEPGCTYQREKAALDDPFQVYFAHLLPFGRRDHVLDAALARAWPMRISLLHRPDFVGLFNQLFEAYATRTPGYSLALKGLALQLLHVIFEELRHAPARKPARAHLNVLQAKRLIEAEYSTGLRLSDIAAHCGLSASHLCSLFRRHLAASPIEYLLHVRLREAKLLLARGARVKEAAYAVGFGSQHYFSRLFRKKTGMSPTEFSLRQTRR